MTVTALICPDCARSGGAWALLAGSRSCANPACGRPYGTLRGTPIPVVTPTGTGPFDDVVVDPTDPDDVAEWIRGLRPGTDGWEAAIRLGMYGRSHHRDGALVARLVDRFLAELTRRVRNAVDLGCGTGGLALAMAATAPWRVIGIDRWGTALRVAQAVASGAVAHVPVLDGDGVLRSTPLPAPSPGPGTTEWLCADLSAPPLVRESFDLVAVVNVLDSVPDPVGVLARASALVAPGGWLLVAQPDAWNPTITASERWVHGAEWESLLALHGLHVVDRDDGLSWTLTRSDRVSFHYTAHARLAQRPA